MTVNIWIIISILGFGTAFYILYIVKTDLPKLLKAKKDEWEAEAKRREHILALKEKENIKITEVAKKEQQQQQQGRQKKQKSFNQTNYEKGKEYEAYVADFFRQQNYTVWEHGKEKDVKDYNIDLFIMNKKEAFFVQCKNYQSKNSTVNHNMVKATRADIREYLTINTEFRKLIKNRTKKILYVIPRECLEPGAWRYIKEHNDIMEYRVIPMVK